VLQGRGGVYAGDHLADDTQAIAQLEELRSRGVDYLLIPRTGAWWLDHYSGLRDHLATRYRPLVNDREVGIIYELNDERDGS